MSSRAVCKGKLNGLNKEMLNKLYIKEQKTTTEIAKLFDCSPNTILNRCRMYEIILRPRGTRVKWLDKSVLQKLYVDECKSLKEITETFFCSRFVIWHRCKEYDIPLRNQKIKGITKALLRKLYVEEGKTTREIAKIIGCSYDVIRYKCKQYGIPLRNPGSKKLKISKSTLHRLYIKEGKNLTEIAKIFGCSISPIWKRVKLFGLKKQLVGGN